MDTHSDNIVRTQDVIGKNVKSPSLENLGKIEEIVLNKVSGETQYVVLSFGGFLGLGENYYAFPWKSIHYDKSEESFILNISKDKLKKEHGFDKNNWPDMSQWPMSIDKYYI